MLNNLNIKIKFIWQNHKKKTILLILIVFIFTFLFLNNGVFYKVPNSKGFSLKNHYVLVKPDVQSESNFRSNSNLVLITYDENNKPKREEIPNSQNAYLRVGILPNGSVVWSDVSDGKNFKIYKYENGKTSKGKSLPIFNGENGALDLDIKNNILVSEGGLTRYIYDGNFIIISNDKIAILEKTISFEGQKFASESGIRVHLIDLTTSQDTYYNLFNWPLNLEYYQDSKLFPIKNKEDKAYFLGVYSKNNITDINGMNQTTLDTGYVSNMVTGIGISYLSTSTMIFSGRISGSDYEQYRFTSPNTKLICDITKDYGCVIHLDNPDLKCPEVSMGQKITCPPSIRGQWYLDPEGKSYVISKGNDWKFGLCDTGEFSFLPTDKCLSYSTHSLVKNVNGKNKTLFSYNEFAFPTRHRDMQLSMLSSDQTLAIAEIYPHTIFSFSSESDRAKPIEKLTYAFDINTGKSALLTDNPTDKVLYVK